MSHPELQLPPLLRDQYAIDAAHLNLLAIFHLIAAGLALLGVAFLGLHFALFHAVLSNPAMWTAQKNPPPKELFEMFRWFYVVFGVWSVASAILNLISGLCLKHRTHRVFSVAVAAFNCLQMPLGTVLGVFTIIVLMRDTVRAVYRS
jgi:hypothetical protein